MPKPKPVEPLRRFQVEIPESEAKRVDALIAQHALITGTAFGAKTSWFRSVVASLKAPPTREPKPPKVARLSEDECERLREKLYAPHMGSTPQQKGDAFDADAKKAGVSGATMLMASVGGDISARAAARIRAWMQV